MASSARSEIADELQKSLNTVSRLLLELEQAGYIIRKQQSSQASTIYINLPPDAIEALEASPSRKKVKAIKKCGAIVQEKGNEKLENIECDNDIEPTQKRGDDLLKNDSPTIYNNIDYNINNNTELDIDRKCDSAVVNFFEDKPECIDNSEQISELKNNIAHLEKETQDIYNHLATLKVKDNRQEVNNLWDSVKRNSAHQSMLQIQLDKFKKPKKPHIALREGQRMLNTNQLRKIQKATLSFTNGDTAKSRELGLNMIEEVRFGSLAKKSYKSNKPMSVDFSVNTACMLLKQNRWGFTGS